MTTVSDYQAFHVELTDNIAHVQINRPEKVNSMNAAFWSEIIDIFQWIDETDEVRRGPEWRWQTLLLGYRLDDAGIGCH